MKDFKELIVWRKAHAITLAIYSATRAFPKEELYGLTSQLRRASASIGANIAEGCGRRSDGEIVASSTSPMVQRLRSSITYCWHTTFTCWKKTRITSSSATSTKSSEC